MQTIAQLEPVIIRIMMVTLLPIEPPYPTKSYPDETTRHVILCSEWLEDSVKLRLFSPLDLSQCLEGEVPVTELKQRADEFEIPAETFIRETRQCLSTANGLQGFKYFFNDRKEFTWKKTGALTLIYGSVQLTNSITSEGLVGVLTHLQAENGRLEGENRKLREDHEALQMCHQELIKAHKNTETGLLSKCRLLINSKKAVIRELQEHLKCAKDESREELEDSETPPLVKPFANTSSRKRNTSNRILSGSSQVDSSDDSMPLAFLPKRKDLLRDTKKSEPAKSTIPVNHHNDTQDVAALITGQDSQDCNGLFDDL